MNTKVLYAVIAALVVIGAGIYIYNARQAKAPVENTNGTPVVTEQSNTNTAAVNNAPANTAPANTTFSGEPANTNPDGGADVAITQVTYDGTSFSPATLTVKAGTNVFFQNNSQVNFYPASNPHPTHTDYPGFDALGPIAPGHSYHFQFDKIGTWGYHNHMNPSQHGTIVVTK